MTNMKMHYSMVIFVCTLPFPLKTERSDRKANLPNQMLPIVVESRTDLDSRHNPQPHTHTNTHTHSHARTHATPNFNKVIEPQRLAAKQQIYLIVNQIKTCDIHTRRVFDTQTRIDNARKTMQQLLLLLLFATDRCNLQRGTREIERFVALALTFMHQHSAWQVAGEKRLNRMGIDKSERATEHFFFVHSVYWPLYDACAIMKRSTIANIYSAYLKAFGNCLSDIGTSILYL